MKKIAFIFFNFCLIMLLSCNEKQRENLNRELEIIDVDISKAIDVIDAFSIIDSSYYEIIPIETNDHCLIAEVTKVCIQDNKIFIIDELSKGVYIFNRDGSYLSKIQAVGSGPEEYSHFNDIVILEDRVGVLAPAANKILFYNFDGNFDGEILLNGSWGDTFFLFDKEKVCLLNDWSMSDLGFYHLYLLDFKKNAVSTSLPFSGLDVKSKRGWGLKNHYSLHEKHALVIFSSIDTVYEVSEGGSVCSKYYINILKNRIPEKIAVGDGYKAIESSINNGYIMGVTKIMESSKNVFFTLSNNITAIYNKKDKIVEAFVDDCRMPTRNNVGFTISNSTIINDDLLVTNITGYNCELLKEWVQGKDWVDNEFEKAFYPLLMSRSDQDNPILIIYKLKK